MSTDKSQSYQDFLTEVTWNVMRHLVDGTPLKQTMGEVIRQFELWRGVNEPTATEPVQSNREEYLERNLNDTRESLNHNAEALRQAKQERDTLSAALTASEADVETLKAEKAAFALKNGELVDLANDYSQKLGKANARVSDLEGALRMARERAESYYVENQRLRSGQVEQAQDITKQRQEIQRLADKLEAQSNEMQGLRQAPEVLKRELDSIIQEISQQRDDYAKRATELERKIAGGEHGRQMLQARLNQYVQAYNKINQHIESLRHTAPMYPDGVTPCEEK